MHNKWYSLTRPAVLHFNPPRDTPNMAKQHIRADSRRRKREIGPLAVQLARWRLDRLGAESVDGDEFELRSRALRECIDRLAPKSRRVLDEHYFQHQTLESIGRRRGRSGGAVRMMLLRVRRVLGKCIREKLLDEV